MPYDPSLYQPCQTCRHERRQHYGEGGACADCARHGNPTPCPGFREKAQITITVLPDTTRVIPEPGWNDSSEWYLLHRSLDQLFNNQPYTRKP